MRNVRATGRQLLLAAALGFLMPAPAFSDTATGIHAGGGFSCAVTSQDEALCWGSNFYGQLGDGSRPNSAEPIPVSLPDPVGSVSTALGEHACAVTRTGGVWCWGRNNNGNLGDGSNAPRSDPVQVSGLSSGVAAVAVGSEHSCALTTAGAAWCWGWNSVGQLGDGTTDNRFAPVAVSGLSSGVVALDLGTEHSCALMDDGSMRCWGSNFAGQLGTGSDGNYHSTPVATTGLPGAVSAIGAGRDHSCALSGGAMLCWGGNQSGELGDGSTTSRNDPTPVSGLSSGVSAISAGHHTSCAIQAGAALCWGHNDLGQLGDGTVVQRHQPAAVIGLETDVSAISAGSAHSCALTAQGAVCWGANFTGELGNGRADRRARPDSASLLGLSSTLEIGRGHLCSVSQQGGRARCWGQNNWGQLGDGTTEYRRTPAVVTGLASGVTTVATGLDHSCALSQSGAVHCWGKNGNGQLGDGTNASRSSAALVSGLGSNAYGVSAGRHHSCAIAFGSVWCWGSNGYGELGDGTTNPSTTPVAVSGLPSGPSAVTAGDHHSCAIVVGGAAWCWGLGSSGQLGDGTATDRLTPVAVSGLASGVTDLDAGWLHTCATTQPGDVLCWGNNTWGQLGTGDHVEQNVPALVTGLAGTGAAVSAGDLYSCAALANGEARCWGSNGSNRLGYESLPDSNVPVAVTDLGGAVDIAIGVGTSCALLQDDTVSCWGYNADGHFADGHQEINPWRVGVLPEPRRELALLLGLTALALLRRFAPRAQGRAE